MEPPSKTILVVGLPEDVGRLLEQRLPRVSVHFVAGGREALGQVHAQPYALLIVDDGAGGMRAADVVGQVRAGAPTAALPVLCCFQHGCDGGTNALLADPYTRLMFSAEPEEVLRMAASILGLEAVPSDQKRAMEQALARLRERFQGTFRLQLQQVESAAVALREGRLTSELRHAGYYDAHKLAGSLGTFGYWNGSRVAREIEELLRGSAPLENESPRLSELVAELRREIERPPADL